ncbi:MAG TPA: mechanosensitive ion channel domain-containing protein, partial [Polyangiaceae bacterium]|nr:mechanosensitive ion channel domain-containing protein [Polyangiaceae bacterium]
LVRPVTDIAGRVASALPLGAIGLVAVALVALGLRFIDLFFTSASRNETVIPWVPADVARPTGTLLKLGLVLVALSFAAPVLTGNGDGVLPRSAIVALGTLGLAATPLLASLAVGVAVIFTRQLRVGDHVVFGGKRGRVRAIGLLSVVLEAGPGVEVRVPQLLALFHPTEVFGPLLRTGCEVPVSRTGNDVADALRRAALSIGTQPEVELLSVERDLALYRVSVLSDRRDARSALLAGSHGELSQLGVELGRRSNGSVSSTNGGGGSNGAGSNGSGGSSEGAQ